MHHARPRCIGLLSLSARRAWIEIIERGEGLTSLAVALRKESVDRNNHLLRCSYTDIASLSARRAWIEMQGPRPHRAGSRSLSARRAWIEIGAVTPMQIGIMSLSARRAWIEIPTYRWQRSGIVKSLSARRAWIEMSPLMWPWSPLNVALRKESVDRNACFSPC